MGLYLLLTGAQSDISQATAESMNREIKENIPETVEQEHSLGGGGVGVRLKEKT